MGSSVRSSTCSSQRGLMPAGDEVAVDSTLAVGGFGVVSRGRWGGQQVAVKQYVYPEHGGPGRGPQHAVLEAAASYSIKHANLVQTMRYEVLTMAPDQLPAELKQVPYVQQVLAGLQQRGRGGAGKRTETLCVVRLVQEYCDLGTLLTSFPARYVAQSFDADFEYVLHVTLSVARGLAMLHSHNIIHGDLNPNNILLASSRNVGAFPEVKVADLGLSVRLSGSRTVSDFRAGTPFYIAPEVILFGMLTKAADVHAFGILLWEVYHSRPVYVRDQQTQQYQPHPKFPRFPLSCPLPYALLTGLCLAPGAEQRPTFGHVVSILEGLQGALARGVHTCTPGSHNQVVN